MAATLTLSLALYLFLIIIPGYLSMAVAGYPVNDKGNFSKILIRGSIILLMVTVILIRIGQGRFSVQFLQMLKDGKVTEPNVLFWYIFIMITTSVVIGLLQLIFDYNIVIHLRKSNKFLKLLRKFKKNTIDVSPGDSLKKIFTSYRIINKRPLVKIYLGTKQEELVVTGEVLCFNWNGHEHLLLQDTESCKLTWVEINSCKSIEFLNLQDIVKPILHLADMRRERGEFLDMIHPGLSESFLDETGELKRNTAT